MATARNIVTRALKRLGVAPGVDEVSAEDAADTLAALNDLMHGWQTHSVYVLHTDYTLDSTVNFFVPPVEGVGRYYGQPRLMGTWDASINVPPLASSVGTAGDVWRVGVTGNTALDGLQGWFVGDWLVFDGASWLRGRSSRFLEESLISVLAMTIAPEYGVQPNQQLVIAADNGWRQIMAACYRAAPAQFDAALIGGMHSRRGW